MNDLPTQLWHHQQKRKKGLWSILSKASEAKDAQKVAALQHEVSRQYEDKDE